MVDYSNKSTLTKEDSQPLTICGCPRSLQMAPKHYMVDCLPLWRAESLKNRRLFDRLTVCLCARRIIVKKAAFLTGEKSCKRGRLGKLIDQWSACFRAALIWICLRCHYGLHLKHTYPDCCRSMPLLLITTLNGGSLCTCPSETRNKLQVNKCLTRTQMRKWERPTEKRAEKMRQQHAEPWIAPPIISGWYYLMSA